MRAVSVAAAAVLLSSCGATSKAGSDLLLATTEETLAPVVREVVAQDYDGLTTDKLLTAYVQQISDQTSPLIRRHIPNPHPVRAWVLNAGGSLCFPSLAGDVLISRGLIMFCDNEDELVAVIALEAVKAALGHSRRSISDGLPNGLMLDRAADETRSGRARAGEPSETASTWIAVNALSRAVESARFTSAQEEEADRHVIRVLVESNHNPSALTAILLRILRKEVDSGRYGDLHRVTEARAGGIARHISEHYASAMGRQYETRRFDAGTRRAEQIRKAFTWVEHAEVSLARGDTARALKYLDDAVALRPSDPFLLLARGRARFAANQPAEAEIDFNAAISRTHGIESLFVGRARARHALGSYATAADDLREAVDLARRPESFLLLGECEERQARYNAARAALVNCITLAGFDPSTVPPSHAPAAAREAYDRLQIVLRRLR